MEITHKGIHINNICNNASQEIMAYEMNLEMGVYTP